MLSPRPLTTLDLDTDQDETASFLALNQEVWQFLLAFLRMSTNFKFAFAEINFPPDSDTLITELMNHPDCDGIHFLVVNLDNPNLLFVLDELKKAVRNTQQKADKKTVLIVKGMEKSIGTNKDFPAVLTNLNYARDNFLLVLPYPILFLLPEYAVNRLAQFAPDFWSWTTANFKFQTTERVLNWAMQETSSDLTKNRVYAESEQIARIDLLERLLQEYPEDAVSTLPTRLEILEQLGTVYQSIRNFETAKKYLQQSLDISIELKDKQGEAIALHRLGSICSDLREFDEAILNLKKSLEINESIKNEQSTADNYHLLGYVSTRLREWNEAYNNYFYSLEVKKKSSDRYSQAVTYHQLGRVSQELRELDNALYYYHQALAIKVEFGDRYSQASTYHNLGQIAQELREWDDARHNYHQALAIYIQFGDVYSQASTYHQLGVVAQELKEWNDARYNYHQALAIKVKFGDLYSQASTYFQLGRLAEDADFLEDAIVNFIVALEILTEFRDEYWISITQSNLGRVRKQLGLSKAAAKE
jgi:tetratricopeptide (TPR) repeat protein